jgi:heterodisulfide reductase subunit A
MPERVGVYVCHCGINIAAGVDVASVAEFAATLPNVVVARHYLYMCSEPGQALIKQDIEELGLTRVVVASCSPRMHEPTFRGTIGEKGLNPYEYDQANIREQCSWVHPPGERATNKAKELVAAAVARVAGLEPLEERTVTVRPATIVVGGGVAGMTAAKDIADAGFQVTLVEQTSALGGQARRLYRTFPTVESVDELLVPIIEAVTHHPRITVMLDTKVEKVSGYIGNFVVTVASNGAQRDIETGTMIIAIGYAPFEANRRPELGYGKYPGVATTFDIEQRLREDPESLRDVKDVVFIQCVGSRDKQVGNPYCSRVCCMVSAKQAFLLREMLPEARVTVLYIDMRAFGKGFEEFYDEVRKRGVRYRRGNASEVFSRDGRLIVRAEDTLRSKPMELPADLVVLSVGMTARPEADQISDILKLPRSGDGFFMELHPKLGPVDTTVDGVYLAGACQAPKDITDTISQARAAASSALIPMMRHIVKVESAVSRVTAELCSGCGLCVATCPYYALALDPRTGTVRTNPALCKGCGACGNVCPSNAIKVQHYKPEQVLAQVDALITTIA